MDDTDYDLLAENHIIYLRTDLEHGDGIHDDSVPVYVNLLKLQNSLAIDDIFFTYGDDDLKVDIPVPDLYPAIDPNEEITILIEGLGDDWASYDPDTNILTISIDTDDEDISVDDYDDPILVSVTWTFAPKLASFSYYKEFVVTIQSSIGQPV